MNVNQLRSQKFCMGLGNKIAAHLNEVFRNLNMKLFLSKKSLRIYFWKTANVYAIFIDRETGQIFAKGGRKMGYYDCLENLFYDIVYRDLFVFAF